MSAQATRTSRGPWEAVSCSGSGLPVLLMASGGFDSVIEKWSTTSPWRHFLPLQTLARDYTCMAYDRREAGQSGGLVERLTWAAYAAQQTSYGIAFSAFAPHMPGSACTECCARPLSPATQAGREASFVHVIPCR